MEDLIFDLQSYMQDLEYDESNLPEIQKRLFFLKNLERTFALELPQLIEKRDQLKTYFLKNNTYNEIRDLELQLKNLQINLNSLLLSSLLKEKNC